MKWFRGLRGRILAILGVCLALTAFLFGISYSGSSEVKKEIDNITSIRMPSIKGLESMNEGQTAVLQTLMALEFDVSADKMALWERYETKRRQITDGFKLYEPLPQSEDESVEYTNIFTKVWPAWEAASGEYASLKKAGRHEAAKVAFAKFVQTFEPAEKSLSKLIEINYKNAEVDKSKATEFSRSSISQMVATAVGGLFLTLFLGLTITAKTTRVLQELSERINVASTHVASTSVQIASSARSLSSATTEQASSLEQTSASLEEITSMIAKATDNAGLTAETSERSHSKAQEGRAVVDKMLSSMNEISESNEAILRQTNESNTQMSEIVKVIQDIGNRTKVINDIVFQTKLLSFNASVEAARAGEQGKGFAVVAEEVGKLAQMSGDAAKEITDMLAVSISKVEDIIQRTQSQVEILVRKSKDKVESGTAVAGQCSEILNDIVQNVSKVSKLASEISQASHEQAQGVSEINKAVSQLDTVTHQNSAASEQSASASQELSQQANSLKNSVQELMDLIDPGEASEANAERVIRIREAS